MPKQLNESLQNTKNKNLQEAKNKKNDEFYTSYEDIKKELINYAKYFKGKTIYCNCDDHRGMGFGTPKSNFLKYLADNFQAFELKKVIATHYERDKKSTKYILTEDNTGDGIISLEDILEMPLNCDGDFRSRECIELLKEADIVITNPPFSLFREYLAQLVGYKKKFIIIGTDDCRTYKEIFPLLKNNQMWCGLTRVKIFTTPEGKTQTFGKIGWYTNFPNKRQNEILNTGKTYKGYEAMYLKYDNYEAIEVSKVADIPMDYDEVMGVPASFIDKHNPKQFEIVCSDYEIKQGMFPKLLKKEWKGKTDRAYLKGKRLYSRILIKRKEK